MVDELVIYIASSDMKQAEDIYAVLMKTYGKNLRIPRFSSIMNVISDIKMIEQAPDAIFIDISMEGWKDAAGCINENYKYTRIVFMSAIEKYTSEVYDYRHVYHMIMPAAEEDIKKAAAKLEFDGDNDRLFRFSLNHKKYAVDINDIIYMEKDRRKVFMKLKGEKHYEFYSSMDELIVRLPENMIRCHNSYLINMNNVETLYSSECMMNDGSRIPISRTYAKQVMECFDGK